MRYSIQAGTNKKHPMVGKCDYSKKIRANFAEFASFALIFSNLDQTAEEQFQNK
jgi:hypothetical protein